MTCFRWPWAHRAAPTGGTEARIQAERDLAQSVARRSEVTRLARSLRELREENHFIERVELMFQGRRP